MWLIGAQYGHTRVVYPAAAATMNGHGSFSGVGAFSVVGHNGVHSSMKIIKKLGLLVFFGGGRLWAVRGGKIGEAHFRISHILLTQNRNAVRECA